MEIVEIELYNQYGAYDSEGNNVNDLYYFPKYSFRITLNQEEWPKLASGESLVDREIWLWVNENLPFSIFSYNGIIYYHNDDIGPLMEFKLKFHKGT